LKILHNYWATKWDIAQQNWIISGVDGIPFSVFPLILAFFFPFSVFREIENFTEFSRKLNQHKFEILEFII
jgi:TRAP-type C4-dicarboxylate transport system permease small subunit